MLSQAASICSVSLIFESSVKDDPEIMTDKIRRSRQLSGPYLSRLTKGVARGKICSAVGKVSCGERGNFDSLKSIPR
jgi:hypothetical protein